MKAMLITLLRIRNIKETRLTHPIPPHIINKANKLCDDEKEVRESSLLASSGGWKPNGSCGWGSSEHTERSGPLRVKQGGTARTSSRPCSLNATGASAFLILRSLLAILGQQF